jgi:hypothetical protein
MRAIISVMVASILFIFVAYLAYSAGIILPDYWTQLAVVLTAIALGILYWGFRPRINRLVKERGNPQESKAETVVVTEGEKQKSALLPDIAHIAKLSINESLLDAIYEQAQRKATSIYHDTQLSLFSIQVYPFMDKSVNIYLYFYSKWADKTCTFRYSNRLPQVEHSPPDTRPKSDSGREVFTTLPWKESPQWAQFLERAYAKIGPFATALGTNYHLFSYPTRNTYWCLLFHDGFSGTEYDFEWNGKGLDENSIKQLS